MFIGNLLSVELKEIQDACRGHLGAPDIRLLFSVSLTVKEV